MRPADCPRAPEPVRRPVSGACTEGSFHRLRLRHRQRDIHEQGTVTQELLVELSQENVGQVLTRAMSVADDRLTIRLRTSSIDGEPVTRELTWKRVG
jgi:hypothetical protein